VEIECGGCWAVAAGICFLLEFLFLLIGTRTRGQPEEERERDDESARDDATSRESGDTAFCWAACCVSACNEWPQ